MQVKAKNLHKMGALQAGEIAVDDTFVLELPDMVWVGGYFHGHLPMPPDIVNAQPDLTKAAGSELSLKDVFADKLTFVHASSLFYDFYWNHRDKAYEEIQVGYVAVKRYFIYGGVADIRVQLRLECGSRGCDEIVDWAFSHVYLYKIFTFIDYMFYVVCQKDRFVRISLRLRVGVVWSRGMSENHLP